MSAIRVLLERLRGLLGGAPSRDARMDEEFRFHVEMETEKNVRAGMTPAEARRRAHLAFGGAERHREAMRDGRTFPVLQDLATDARLALRGLRRAPGYAAVAVLTLAVGVGAVTAMFGGVDAVLLRSLPYAEADDLAMVYAQHAEREIAGANIAYPDYTDWKSELRSFDGLGVFTWWTGTLEGAESAERVTGAEVSAEVLPLLGVAPVLGRVFDDSEAAAGGARVVVLGHGVWQRRFGGDEGVLGQALVIDGEPHTVIGVMPAGFAFPYDGEAWVPLRAEGDWYARRDARFLGGAVARLRAGVTWAEARTELAEVSRRLEAQYPESNGGWAGQLVPMREDVFGPLRTALIVLFAAAGLVLLIACANVASLVLARGAGREREMAVRTAIGAGRGRLIRQLLAESGVLALFGGAAGLVLALWLMAGLRARLADRLPPFAAIRVEPAVFVFALAVTALIALLFGLLPALRSARAAVHAGLGTRGGAEGAGDRLRAGLVVAQVALAVVMLVGSTLLFRSMAALSSIDPGFDASSVLTARFTLPESSYPEPARRRAFVDGLLETLSAVPGVTLAAAAQGTPFSGWNVSYRYTVEGEPAPRPGEVETAHVQSVTPGYFDAIGVPLVAGRSLDARDDASGAPVAVVNEAFVRRHFGDTGAIGRRVRFGPEADWITIVGIVRDFRHFTLTQPMGPAVFTPYAAAPPAQMTLAVRTAVPPVDLAPALRRALADLDPRVPAYRVETLADVVARQTWVQRTARDIAGAFALVAAFLAGLGLYGLVSYSVTRQRRQLAIRLALGATPAGVRTRVVTHALRLAAAGIVAGTLGALAASRLLRALLFDVQPTDPRVLVAVPLAVATLAAAASYGPARRAARLDPATALRAE